MLKSSTTSLLLVSLLFINCIGEDVIDDFVEPELRITNSITEIEIFSTYQFTVTYFNNVGQEENVPVTWQSSNTDVATITSGGLLSALA